MTRPTHLALLRGINVGGKNKLPMATLVDMFIEAGCKDVRTYIQSGNVVFSVSKTESASIPDRITTRIAERYGYRVPVILRTTEQLRDHERLLRLEARDDRHQQELANGDHAPRVDGRKSVSSSRFNIRRSA